MSRHLDTGRLGEDLAADFLRQKGLRVLEKNVRTHFGEIDMICRDGRIIVFVEVKTRTSTVYGSPLEAVTRQKIKRLSRAALSYLAGKSWLDRPARFDVLGLTLTESEPRYEYLPDAFDVVTD